MTIQAACTIASRTADTSCDGPLFPVADCLARVVANDPVRAEYHHLVLQGEPPATLAGAGQFFQILCPGVPPEQPFLRRPMSVYRADPDANCIEFLYKVTGMGTRGLASLRRSDHLSILGPLGNGFRLDQSWKHI